jgi:hypothetical protein
MQCGTRQDAFTRFGLPVTFITDFESVVNQVQEAEEARLESKNTRRRATAGIKAALATDWPLFTILDGFVTAATQRDPATFAVVGRAPCGPASAGGDVLQLGQAARRPPLRRLSRVARRRRDGEGVATSPDRWDTEPVHVFRSAPIDKWIVIAGHVGTKAPHQGGSDSGWSPRRHTRAASA